jgi:hypothetical protein
MPRRRVEPHEEHDGNGQQEYGADMKELVQGHDPALRSYGHTRPRAGGAQD